jgi:entericidin B
MRGPYEVGTENMTAKILGRIAIVSVALISLSACGNTIRGVGADTANAVNATQAAGQDISSAAQ